MTGRAEPSLSTSHIDHVLQGRSIDNLPPEVREAVLVCREYEEETAAHETLLANWVRAETRHYGGVYAIRARDSAPVGMSEGVGIMPGGFFARLLKRGAP